MFIRASSIQPDTRICPPSIFRIRSSLTWYPSFYSLPVIYDYVAMLSLLRSSYPCDDSHNWIECCCQMLISKYCWFIYEEEIKLSCFRSSFVDPSLLRWFFVSITLSRSVRLLIALMLEIWAYVCTPNSFNLADSQYFLE